MRYDLRTGALSVVAILSVASLASAQVPGITLPPSGDNQRSVVTQYIGPVAVTIDYHSPNVHGPSGEDRTGKIWGTLVPYGMAALGFGTCGDQCPWRGGANENTVFSVSHDVEIEGARLPAGKYGLHFIAGAEQWTVIFSKNSTSWGSYFYDAKEDALRVVVKPAKIPYTEWLTYEFTDRQPESATVALEWEYLQLPWTIRVPDITGVYVETLRREMRSAPGFSWLHQNAAAQYCLQNKTNLEEALGWAQKAANPQVGGQENFTTLSTVAQLLEATGKAAEAATMLDRAINHPTADAITLHRYGRALLNQKKLAEAMKVFELNAKRHNGAWPTQVGLMRGHAALGHQKEALEHAREALKQAPDEQNRKNLEGIIKRLEAGQPIG
jgi:hypothetical protein